MNVNYLMHFANNEFDLMHQMWRDYVSLFSSISIANVNDQDITLDYLSYKFDVKSKLVVFNDNPHFQVRFSTTDLDCSKHYFDLFIDGNGGLFHKDSKSIHDIEYARNYDASVFEKLIKRHLSNFLLSSNFFKVN